MEKIFKWFTFDDDLTTVYVAWFSNMFEVEDFSGVERLFVSFLKYCAFLGITAQRRYLESFLVTDGKKTIREYNIKLDTMSSFDYKDPASLEEAYRVICKTAMDIYDKWCLEDLSERTFKVDMYSFMETSKKNAVQSVMIKYFPQLQEGKDVDDLTDGLQDEITRKSLIFDKNKIDEIDFMCGMQRSKSGKTPMRKLFDTGVPCIDGDAKGVYTKQCVTFTGQPGSGKTRFVNKHYIYPALINGMDVIYDSVEMKQFQIENMLIAIHIINLFGGTVKIPDSVMNKSALTTEQKQYYESARIDLFESGKYGKLFYRNSKDVPVELMYKKTMNLKRMNKNIQLWVIDYMGRLKSQPTEKYSPHLQQYEIITKAYELVEDLIDVCDIAAVCLNQYNEKGIAACYAGKPILPGYVEGGHIVQRHSDYDIAMTFTEEQKLAKIRALSTVKLRDNEGFSNVLFNTDLSISNFMQMNRK